MEWIEREDQLPTGDRQVLTFSSCYTEENDPGGRGPYRVMNTQYVRMANDVSYWSYIDDPEYSRMHFGEGYTIRVTVKEIQDRGIWDAVCQMTGLNVWAVNEGLISSSDEVTLTGKQAQELGILT